MSEQPYGRDPTGERLGLALCGLLEIVGWALALVFGYVMLGDLLTSIRDWWHGADWKSGNWLVGLGFGTGYLLIVSCRGAREELKRERVERHQANWKRLDAQRREQAIENRRQARFDFADDRARQRLTNARNPDWEEPRIPEELWEGCEARNQRLHDWHVLLGLEFDWDNDRWVKLGTVAA